MATKRMFSNVVIDSDPFLDLSPMAQLLYFHLGMKTDDDGFILGSGRIARLIGASPADFHELTEAGFLIEFPESKLFLMTHHRLNNDLKNDRYHPTIYTAEFSQLELTTNKTYRKHVSELENSCVQIGDKAETEQNVTHRNPSQRKETYPIVSIGEESDERGTVEYVMSVRHMAQQYGISNEIESIIQESGAETAYQTMRAWIDDNKREPVMKYLRKEGT